MSNDKTRAAIKTPVSELMKWKLPLQYRGQNDCARIYDADDQFIAELRGWGYLTGTGGLHLDPEEAATVQDARGQAIADALNQHAHLEGERDAAIKAIEIAVGHFDRIIAFADTAPDAEVYKEIVHHETADEFNEVAQVRTILAALRGEE